MKTVKQKEKESYEVLKEKFGYKNRLAAPRLAKVSINVGTGSGMKKDKHRNELVMDRISKITGQKASIRGAKQSIASFKIRQGDQVGVSVTLRGLQMYSFLDKLFNIAIPRTKDFRGLDVKSVDNIGNITLAVKEHTIFPEATDEELKDVFSFAITIVTTSKNKAEATEFFRCIGVPFK